MMMLSLDVPSRKLNTQTDLLHNSTIAIGYRMRLTTSLKTGKIATAIAYTATNLPYAFHWLAVSPLTKLREIPKLKNPIIYVCAQHLRYNQSNTCQALLAKDQQQTVSICSAS